MFGVREHSRTYGLVTFETMLVCLVVVEATSGFPVELEDLDESLSRLLGWNSGHTKKNFHFKISYFEIYQDFRVFLLSLLKSFEITCVCQGDSK